MLCTDTIRAAETQPTRQLTTDQAAMVKTIHACQNTFHVQLVQMNRALLSQQPQLRVHSVAAAHHPAAPLSAHPTRFPGSILGAAVVLPVSLSLRKPFSQEKAVKVSLYLVTIQGGKSSIQATFTQILTSESTSRESNVLRYRRM